MKTFQSYPLKFKPLYQEKIWGGRNLEKVLGRNIQSPSIGESWEICDRGKDQTLVENGDLAGQSLHDIMTRLGNSFLGEKFRQMPERFPLLFKIIDAKDDLSIQVHPDDESARKRGEKDPGKTEMWYVLDSYDKAKIYCGLKPGVGLKELKAGLSGSFSDCLMTYSAHAGDVFFIPAGTVHALGKGNLVIEIQENSDITYRLSDWGRVGKDGKPRALHIEQGLEAAQIQPGIKPFHVTAKDKREALVSCPYFEVHEKTVSRAYSETISKNSFQVWIFIEGRGTINGVEYKKGNFMLLPANIGNACLSAESPTRFLKVFIP